MSIMIKQERILLNHNCAKRLRSVTVEYYEDDTKAKLEKAIEALKEIHEQSIAHSDDSLSSKWLETITREVLKEIEG